MEVQTQLLAFDRQNHMGASDSLAKSLKKAIKEEAEAMLNEKKVVSGAVNIQENADKMKVPIHIPSPAAIHDSASSSEPQESLHYRTSCVWPTAHVHRGNACSLPAASTQETMSTGPELATTMTAALMAHIHSALTECHYKW